MTTWNTLRCARVTGTLVLTFAILFPFIVCSASCHAAQTSPQANGNTDGTLDASFQDKQIAKFVAMEMAKRHFSKKPIDRTIADRAMSLYFKSLDPRKLYFYQSDVDEVMKSQADLPERLVKGDIQIGFDIYNTYLKRFDERTAMVLDILSKPIDFTADEEIVVDKKLWTYPKTPEESYDRWKKFIKLEILNLRNEAKNGENISEKKAATEDPVERLKKRYTSLQKRIHKTGNDEILEVFLTSVTSAYDPHSSYMSPSTVKNFEILMSLQLEGIGATLSSEDGYTTIKALVSGGAAERDGRLKVEDKIIGVGQGKDGEIEDVVDRKLNDVVSMIRGKPGTVVKLEVLASDNEKKTIEIVREKIQLKDSEAHAEVLEVGKKADGTPYLVGVINLPSFYLNMDAAQQGDPEGKSTTKDLRNILDKFNAQKVDAVVLDLRNNGGGSLPEAITAVGLFIETGTVVQVKEEKATRAIPQMDPDPSISWTGPLVVMISKFSASASEIFAGAIKDYKRGIIVGDSTTHGKGSVQAVSALGQRFFAMMQNAPDYGSLKMTIQQFYRPAGASPQLKGVTADIVLPSLSDYFKDIAESDLEYPLDYDEVAESSYPTYNYVSPDIVNSLAFASARRVEESKEFQKTLKTVQTYLELKDRKTITLNEEKFNEDRKKDADKEEMDQLKKVIDNESKIVRDGYLEEVLAITADYAGTLADLGVKFQPPTPPRKTSRLSPFF